MSKKEDILEIDTFVNVSYSERFFFPFTVQEMTINKTFEEVHLKIPRRQSHLWTAHAWPPVTLGALVQ